MTVISGDNVSENETKHNESGRRSTSSASTTSSEQLQTKAENHHIHKLPSSIMDSDYKYQFTASTITGVLHFQNAGAFDWSVNGFLAYGCQNKVVVLDTNNTMKYCQSMLFLSIFISIFSSIPLFVYLFRSSSSS